MARNVVASTCTECLVHCGTLIHLEDGKVVKISGNPASPTSEGAVCIKGVQGPMANLDSPTRILHPMRRAGARGEGKWDRIGWDEAFAQIAERIGDVKTKHGGKAVAGAAATFTQSRGTATRLLLRAIGSPNFMINQDMCHGGRSTAGLLTGFGGSAGSELAKSRTILVVGKSPSESDIVEWVHIQAAKAAGATIIVIDPRRTHISRIADIWMTPKVGTDAVLALSMIDVMLRESLYDRAFVDEWCVGLDALRERASRYPPEIAAAISGVPADDIVRAARLFATQTPGSMVLGHGIDAHEAAVSTSVAFFSLLALTGNIDRAGSNRAGKALPGYKGGFGHFVQAPAFRIAPDLQDQILGGAQYPLWTGNESWTQTCHNPAVLQAIETGVPYPVRAMYVSGTNIACTYPDHDATVAALKSLDLLVVASDQMTPTGELADFFLPKTTLLEEEEVLIGQAEPCLEITQQIYAPRGKAKPDVEIVAGLYAALKARGLVDFEVFPWKNNEEFNRYVLKDTGVSLEELREKTFIKIPYGYEDYRKSGFKTPSGKFELAPQRLRDIGFDPLPDYRPEAAATDDEAYDLVLLTGVRTMALHHSRYLNHRWTRRVKTAPELTIHPTTAARHTVTTGDWVWVQTPESDNRALLRVKVSEDVPESIAATGMGWWYPELPGPHHGAATFNIGRAMAYGPHFDPVSGSPARSRNTRCKIVAADPAEIAPLLEHLTQADTKTGAAVATAPVFRDRTKPTAA